MSSYESNRASLSKGRTQRPFEFFHPMTMRAGYFIPVYVNSEVMPATTIDLNVDCSLKALTMTRAPLGSLNLEYIAVFVPHDIIWTDQKQFWGETDNAAWNTTFATNRPQCRIETQITSDTHRNNCSNNTIYRYLPDAASISISDATELANAHKLQLAQYMGYPNNGETTTSDSTNHMYVDGDALGLRAVAATWNFFIRDLNCQDVIGFLKTSPANATSDQNLSRFASDVCPPVNKIHDWATGVIPSPQYGSVTNIPIAGTAPIVGDSTMHGTNTNLKFGSSSSLSGQWFLGGNNNDTNGLLTTGTGVAGTGTVALNRTNMIADLSSATGISLMDFRSIVQINHYKETLAHYGRKMQDTMWAVFGSSVGNAILDEPEGICHVSKNINIQTVTSTAEADSTKGLGYLGGRSETYISDNGAVSYTAKKFGTFLIAAFIRQGRHVYSNVIPHSAHAITLWDQVNPLFAGSSDVPVYKSEIGCAATTVSADLAALGYSTVTNVGKVWSYQSVKAAAANTTLGYQVYGWNAKFPVSYASGGMNPCSTQPLSDFTMADAYSSPVAYGPGYPIEDPKFIGRAFVDQTRFAPQFTAEWHITGSITTPLPEVKVPGLRRI